MVKYIIFICICCLCAGCIHFGPRLNYNLSIRSKIDEPHYIEIKDASGQNFPCGYASGAAPENSMGATIVGCNHKLVFPITIYVSMKTKEYPYENVSIIKVPEIKEDYNNKRVVINILTRFKAKIKIVDLSSYDLD